MLRENPFRPMSHGRTSWMDSIGAVNVGISACQANGELQLELGRYGHAGVVWRTMALHGRDVAFLVLICISAMH